MKDINFNQMSSTALAMLSVLARENGGAIAVNIEDLQKFEMDCQTQSNVEFYVDFTSQPGKVIFSYKFTNDLGFESKESREIN